jgi:hypothetical protein
MEKITQEMLVRLDALAAKLGMAASTLWGYYLRQAYIDGISYLIWVCVLFAMAVFALRKSQKLYVFVTTKDDDYWPGLIIVWLAAAGLVILGLCLLHDGISNLTNPGLAAFRDICAQLK